MPLFDFANDSGEEVLKFSPDQPRNAHGQFSANAGAIKAPEHEGHWDVRNRVQAGDVIPVVDANRGLGLLNQGKFIEADYRTVDAIVDKAAKTGSNADITNIQITGKDLMTQNNVGIPRKLMPQIDPENKAKWLKDTKAQGIAIKEEKIDPAKLKPIQSEMSVGKVGAMRKAILDGSLNINSGNMSDRIIVSKDGYVLDGHHRWAAAALVSLGTKGGITIPTYTMQANYKSCLQQILDWNKANGVALQDIAGKPITKEASAVRFIYISNKGKQ